MNKELITIEATISIDIIRQLKDQGYCIFTSSKIISSSSSNSGESKTIVAHNLIDSLAVAGMKAIYMDGSLR